MCIGTGLRLLTCAASGLCFAGQGATNLMKKDVKMGYGILLLFFSAILFVLVFFGGQWLSYFSLLVNCPSGDSMASCLGLSSVFRISLILAIFHVLVGLSCLTRDKFAKIVNEGLWGWKVLLIAGAFIGTLFIKNDFFLGYAKFSNWASGIFLFIQAVSLIDAFYLWADFWAKKFEDGNSCYGCLLIFASLVMYTAAGFFTYKAYSVFWLKECTGNMVILALGTILMISFTVLIVLKFHPKGSIITSGAISIFGMYLIWATLVSSTSAKCNAVGQSQSNMMIQIGMSFFFAFSCNVYWALSTQRSKAYAEANIAAPFEAEGDEEVEKKEAVKEKAQAAKDEGTNLIKRDEATEDYLEYQNANYLKFHGFMFFFAIYICAVFTNWGFANTSSNAWIYTKESDGPFWIKLLIAFFTLLLYLWTIVAPQVLTDRSFE